MKYELLTKSCLPIDPIEDLLEGMEELKRGFTHQFQHAVGRMLGRNL